MRRPPHIEAACTIAVASHHRALELAGRSLETRRPDAPPRFTSHRRAPASTQPSALRQAPAPLHSTIKSTPSHRLTSTLSMHPPCRCLSIWTPSRALECTQSPPLSHRPSSPILGRAPHCAAQTARKPSLSLINQPALLFPLPLSSPLEPQHRELHSHSPLPLRAPPPSENQATLLPPPEDFAHVFPGQPQLHFGSLPASPCFTEHRRRASSSAEDLHRGQPASSFPFVADHHCEAPFYSLMLTRAPVCFPRIQ